MKKTLALFTLSLLLVAAMMLGVSAAVADSDVGAYICFSSGEAVENHINDTSTSTAVFDAEKGALAVYPKVPAAGDSGNDNYVYIHLSELVDIKQYPYFRATYEIVNLTNSNASSREGYTFLNISTTGKWINKCVVSGAPINDGQKHRVVADYSTGIGSSGLDGANNLEAFDTFMVGDMRMDWPNDVGTENGQYVVYFYDIGFFKTEAAANEYGAALTVGNTAPENVQGVAPTAVDGKGKLTGVDDTMEYCVAGETTYTAVPAGATEVEVDGGKLYNVRYAAEEGYDAGEDAQVGVPYYYNLELNGITGVDGENVTFNDGVYNIEVPYGTDLTSVTLDYTITTSARKSFNAYRAGSSQISTTPITKAPFLAVSNMQTKGTETKAIGAFKAADYLETPITLYAYERFTLFEPVKITFSIAESQLSDEEIVDAVIAALDTRELSADAKLTVAKASDALDAEWFIEGALDIENFLTQYNGVTAVAQVTTFKKTIAGTAADVDGEDGVVEYSFKVKYGNAEKYSATKNIALPAEHFRVIFKFNDADIMSIAKVNGNALDKINVSIVDDKYVRAQFKEDVAEIRPDVQADLYWEIGKYYGKNDATYTSLLDTADYPIVAIKYRSNAYAGNHIYAQTDAYINGENSGEGGDGSYLGYLWAKDRLFWSCNSTTFPVATEFNRAVINANGGTEGVSYAGQGYEGDYTLFPWTGKLNYIRGNITKSQARAQGDYYDVEYVAFFASKASYDAWVAAGEKAAYALTAQDKAAVDAITVGELDGAVISTEALAKAAALAAVEAQLNIEKASIAVNTVSYVAPDSETDTKGAYKFTVTVKKGDKVGDKDVYTSAEFTASISVPVLSAESAAAVISLLDDSVTPAIYNEEGALEYVNNALLADVKSLYAGYTFTVEAETYVAPTAEEDGYLEYTVTVAKGDETASTDVLYLAIAAGEKPIIINFASEVIARYAANVLTTNSGAIFPEEAFEMVEDENALGGAYAKLSRLSGSPEFNFTFYPGKYGFPAIEDLGKYPVVAYRYKAPNHGNYQIYYTTDVTVSGLGYQDFGPTLDVNEWNTHIHTMNPAGNSAGATGSPAWDGNVRNIRFDFFRGFASDAVTLEIDYIGFFESIEQAQAFAAAPHLDSNVTEDDLYEEYSAMLESINDAASEVKYNKNKGLNSIGDAYAALAQSFEGVPGFTITSFTPAVNGTADDIDGTNGEIKYRVAFAESINNGNIILSDEFTDVIVADVYTKGETTAEFRVETESEPAGLRFKTTFTKDWMNFFKENNITLTYGTLVGSADKLGDTELVHGVDNIADVKGVNIFANTETDMTYTAVITGIPVEEVNTDLTARAYVSYTYEYFDYTVYFDAVTVCLNDVLD